MSSMPRSVFWVGLVPVLFACQPLSADIERHGDLGSSCHKDSECDPSEYCVNGHCGPGPETVTEVVRPDPNDAGLLPTDGGNSPPNGGTAPADGGNSPPDGNTAPSDAGAPHGGPITTAGGTVDLLDFTLTGDTRPGTCNSASSYPSAVHQQVVQAMTAVHPQFGLDLGDHMYACGNNAQSAKDQMNLYVQALVGFPAPFFMTMGNHECESQDCSGPSGDANFAAYRSALAAISGKTLPYYAVQIATRFGRATLVVVSDNYFDSTAQAWLEATLTDADANSVYTLIAKHHPVTGTRTGPSGATQVILRHKYSLILTAHDHKYSHAQAEYGGRSVICGLGGANVSHLGFCRVTQTSSGQLSFTQYDINGNPGDSWSVSPR